MDVEDEDEDAPKENVVGGEVLGGCQAELRPKLGVMLVVELPDFISDVATAELRPKLGTEEPNREPPEVDDWTAVVPPKDV